MISDTAKEPHSNTTEITEISKNTEIKGSLTSQANIKIAGSIKGNVTSDANITISGTVEGDVIGDYSKYQNEKSRVSPAHCFCSWFFRVK